MIGIYKIENRYTHRVYIGQAKDIAKISTSNGTGHYSYEITDGNVDNMFSIVPASDESYTLYEIQKVFKEFLEKESLGISFFSVENLVPEHNFT